MGSRPVDPALRRSQFLAAAFEWALSIATVAGLAFVGWLGHSTHWTFGLGQHDDGHGHAAAEPAAQPAEPAAQPVAEPSSPRGADNTPAEEPAPGCHVAGTSTGSPAWVAVLGAAWLARRRARAMARPSV